MKNNTRPQKKLIIIFAVTAVAVLIINLLAGLLPVSARNIDISENKAYSLSAEAKKYLRAVDAETTVYVINSDGSNPRYESFLKQIGNCNDKISVHFVDGDQVMELAEELEVENYLAPYSLIVKGEKRSTFTDYSGMFSYRTDNSTLLSYFGTDEIDALVYNYNVSNLYKSLSSSSDSSVYSVIQAMLYDMDRSFSADNYICKMVEYVNLDNIPARYILTGHDEDTFEDTELGVNLLEMCERLGITYDKLDITGDNRIPEDAVSIFVFYPKKDIEKAEAEKLIEYLSKGGHVTFITANENLEMKNLMSVINAYGLNAEMGIVGEKVEIKVENEKETADTAPVEETESEKTETVYRNTVSVNVNTEHAAMAEMEGLTVSPMVEKPNSILFNNEISSDLVLTPLLTTGESAYLGDKKDELMPMTVAAAAENRKTGGKLLWFTGAASYAEDILTKEELKDDEKVNVVYSNVYCIISTLGWVPFGYTSETPNIPSRIIGADLMSVTSTSFIVFTLAVVVIVAVASATGAIICYKRRKA